jgi:hypothetical protein
MHIDEQYGHLLGAQLQREVEQVHVGPGLVSVLRRRHARRTWVIRTAIATPVVAVAAAVILVSTAGPGAPNRTHQAGNGPTSPVPVQNVAYVQAQTIKAVGQAPQYVVYKKEVSSGGSYDEAWTDRATQRIRVDIYGRSYLVPPPGGSQMPPAPTDENLGPVHLQQANSAIGPNGNRDRFFVDYDDKTWSKLHDSDVLPTSTEPSFTDPDGIQAALNDGTLTLLGPETLNGRDTLHLRMFAVYRGYRIDLWVDATTFLPVQDTDTLISAGDRAQPIVTTTYSWLPRTEQNLAKLVLTAPPGFRHK